MSPISKRHVTDLSVRGRAEALCLSVTFHVYPQSSSTPLHVAVKKGYFEAARLLLRCGADVEAKDKVSRDAGYALATLVGCGVAAAHNGSSDARHGCTAVRSPSRQYHMSTVGRALTSM